MQRAFSVILGKNPRAPLQVLNSLPMTSSDAQALSYMRLIGARPPSMISIVSRGYLNGKNQSAPF